MVGSQKTRAANARIAETHVPPLSAFPVDFENFVYVRPSPQACDQRPRPDAVARAKAALLLGTFGRGS